MIGEKKLISVIIPVYNVRDYLRKTLDCIIEQTYENWELLLVDDGSNDGSLEIAIEYQNKDNRIRSIRRDSLPKGAPACRNIGLNEAKGDFIIYLDSDDIIAPFCFHQRINYILENPCDFAVFPLVGFYKKLFDAPGMLFGYKPEGDVVSSLLSRTLPFVVVSNIYKRESLIKSNIRWDTSFKSYQDSDYNLQAINAGLTYKISNLLPDYYYRLSAQNSICKKLSTSSNCESQIQFLAKQTKIYGKKNYYRKSLMICGAQIYQNILGAENNGDAIKKFTSLELFQKDFFLSYKFSVVAKLTARITNFKVIDLIQLLFMPTFFIRFKIHFRKWGKHNRMLYSEINNIYQERVEESVKKVINEKI